MFDYYLRQKKPRELISMYFIFKFQDSPENIFILFFFISISLIKYIFLFSCEPKKTKHKNLILYRTGPPTKGSPSEYLGL